MGQVEALQAEFARTIDAESGEHMHDVVGFLESVQDELLSVCHRRRVDQGVGRDALAGQLVGVAATKAPCRQGLESIEVDGLGAPAIFHQLFEMAVSQQVTHHLLAEGAVFEAARHSENALKGVGVLEELGQAGHHLQALEPFLEVELHLISAMF